MDNETTQFEVGQEVEYLVTCEKKNTWKRGAVIALIDYDSDMVLLDIDGEIRRLSRYINHIRPIESDPTPQPAAIQYPPLRVLIDGKPSQTWQQVLESKPLATQQPHLYLLGRYEKMLWKTFQTFSQANAAYLITHREDGTDDYSTEFHLFIITEGA